MSVKCLLEVTGTVGREAAWLAFIQSKGLNTKNEAKGEGVRGSLCQPRVTVLVQEKDRSYNFNKRSCLRENIPCATRPPTSVSKFA
jgi:hypothetical protein